MNQWPFVIAAYGVTVGAVGALLAWATIAMLRSERRLDQIDRG